MGFRQADCFLTIPVLGFNLAVKTPPFNGRAEIVFSSEFSLVAFTKIFPPFWDLFFHICKLLRYHFSLCLKFAAAYNLLVPALYIDMYLPISGLVLNQ